MKDYLIGFLSGILLTFGMVFWLGDLKLVGITLIIIGWFLGVVVYNHYYSRSS